MIGKAISRHVPVSPGSMVRPPLQRCDPSPQRYGSQVHLGQCGKIMTAAKGKSAAIVGNNDT